MLIFHKAQKTLNPFLALKKCGNVAPPVRVTRKGLKAVCCIAVDRFSGGARNMLRFSKFVKQIYCVTHGSHHTRDSTGIFDKFDEAFLIR